MSLSAVTVANWSSGVSRRDPWRVAVRGLVGIVCLFVAAELATRAEFIPHAYLPMASTVIASTADLLQDGAFLANCASTLGAWAMALGLAVVVAVPIGIVLGSSETAYRLFTPLIEFMRPVPPAALIPLAILILGQGSVMKVWLAAYAMAWPVLYNTVYGVHGVDPVALQAARVFGLGRMAIARRIVLPAAAPLIFTGIRISASLGLVVIVSAEMLAAATSGIGAYILNISANGGQMDKVLAAAVVAGLMGLAINAGFALLDRRFLSWRHRGDDGQ